LSARGTSTLLNNAVASAHSPIAEILGNKFFASMGLKMMLDYRHRTMTFFGDCR
jgi:hypothetical protein